MQASQGKLLEITVVHCDKLKDTEWFSRQDPYVCVEYGGNRSRTHTYIDGGKNPTFQEKFVYSMIEGLRELNVVVWNSNTLTFDDFIGSAKVQLDKVISHGFDDCSWQLHSKSGRYAGEVQLIMRYTNANGSPISLPLHNHNQSSIPPTSYRHLPMEAIHGIHGNLLEVTVVSCNKLKDTEWLSRQHPYVCLEYGSNSSSTRTDTDGGKNLTGPEKFVYRVIEGLRELNVTVWNRNTVSNDEFIGSAKVQLDKVISHGFDDNKWPLQSKSGRYAGEVRLVMHCTNANNHTNGYASASTYVASDPQPSPHSSTSCPPLFPPIGPYTAIAA